MKFINGILSALYLMGSSAVFATDYYVDSQVVDSSGTGLSSSSPFKNLSQQSI